MRSMSMEIPDEELHRAGFDGLLRLLRERAVRRVEFLRCLEAGALLLVDAPLDASVVAEIESVESIHSLGDSAVIEVTAPELDAVFARYARESFVDGPIEVADDHVKLTFVATQSVITALQTELRESLDGGNIDCTIRSLNAYDGDADPTDRLTSRQREVMRHAYEAGYYEIPRRTSSETLATQLGIDKSTVLEHLQRAENNVVAGLFGEDGG